MAATDSGPLAPRASDADRENAIHALRDGAAEGRLSHDTFLHRMSIALRARRLDELSGLLGDLPAPVGKPAARGRALLTRAVTWWSGITAELESAWRSPRLAKLVLPRGDQAVLTIGRSPVCDLTVADLTVSWRHAELRRTGDGWMLADAGSKNGTRVNGWRAGKGLAVRAGDVVTFGRAAFRAADGP
jgi:Domain of unknown function (DUF1707)/FHA domain